MVHSQLRAIVQSDAWIEVDLDCLCENARAIQVAAKGCRLLPVVKANGYGLGAVEIATALESVAPWGYAVATMDEAIRMREADFRRPILVLRPPHRACQKDYEHYALRPVVESVDAGAGWKVPFHVEIDTGMGRARVRWDDECALNALACCRPEGAFTHLFAADEKPSTVPIQTERFRIALAAFGTRPPLLHVANSAGIWTAAGSWDLVRPGLFLYGGRPSLMASQPQPVVSVKARVVSVRQILRGESVSYGGDWCAQHNTFVATLPIGYADGIPRALSGKGEVLIQGFRCPIVGRVTMDMIMVDVGAMPVRPSIEDIAVLIGTSGRETISLDDFAALANSIPYEILTGLGSRLPRFYRISVGARASTPGPANPDEEPRLPERVPGQERAL